MNIYIYGPASSRDFFFVYFVFLLVFHGHSQIWLFWKLEPLARKYVSLSVSICEFKTCNLNTEYDFKKYSLAFDKIVV
jgi:hypothetical protein